MQPTAGHEQGGAWLRGGHREGRKKTKAQRQVSVQEVGLYILVMGQRNEASGKSAGRATGRIRDPRAGVWRQSYKVYKESVSLQ